MLEEGISSGVDASGVGEGGKKEAEVVLVVEDVIRQLHGGQIRAEELTAEVRQQCVSHLTMEGFTSAEIAQLMRVNERTVRRDRAGARKERAVEPRGTLGDELLGEFEAITMGSVARLVRMARDSATPAYARLWAEEAIVRNYQRYVEMARKMKYVEEGAKRIVQQREREEEPAKRAWEERQKLGAKLVMERLRRMAGIEGEGNGESWRELVDIVMAKRGIRVEEYEYEEEEEEG